MQAEEEEGEEEEEEGDESHNDSDISSNNDDRSDRDNDIRSHVGSGSGSSDPKDELLKAFQLKRVAKELWERMADEERREMIDEADRDGDEFLRIMKEPNLF